MYKAHRTGQILRRDQTVASYDIFWSDDRVPLVDRATYQDFPLWEARQVGEAMNSNAYGVGVYGA